VLIAIWHIIPAIRAVNTVVNKPSPYTPCACCGRPNSRNEVLPVGVVNGIAGDDTIGAAMSTHPTIDKIVFTGSASTGKKVKVGKHRER
jgi:acyl-CoA reductase-like NAD-dependent aldehyde dehydrogenase